MATTQLNGKTVTEALFARKDGAMVKVGEYVPDERRLGSWSDLTHGDELVYVGDSDTYWPDAPLTFVHRHGKSGGIRFRGARCGRWTVAPSEYSADEFVVVGR